MVTGSNLQEAGDIDGQGSKHPWRSQAAQAQESWMAPDSMLEKEAFKCHVLIVGCGLGGLAAAISIRRAGHDVTMLEKNEKLQEVQPIFRKAWEIHLINVCGTLQVGAGINITPNATMILKELCILDAIRSKANTPYTAMMRSYSDGAELSKIDLGRSIEDRYKAPYMVIHRADLHSALLDEALRLGVSIRLNSQIANFDLCEPSLHLATGEKFTADLIIGADGERSSCRGALLGHDIPAHDSGDHVFRITVPTCDVLQHSDLVSLVEPPCINLWVGPGSHAMSYALKRDGLLNIVLTCAHDASHVVRPGPQRAEIEEAREAFKDWDQKFQALLSLAQGCAKWTLVHTPMPNHWVHPEGKFALLGDSAHAMLPFIGQGAAMAFEDAAVIGTLLSKAKHKSQLGDLLTIYERLRKPRTTMLGEKSRAMRDVYAYDDGPIQKERDRQLRQHPPFDGYANFLADPSFQSLLFDYNAKEEAENAWNVYLKGEWPSTSGNWAVKLEPEA